LHCAILRCLLEGDSYGYALRQRLAQLRCLYPLTNVNIYAPLNELLDAGCVTSRTEVAGARARRIYSITAAGRAALTGWVETRPEAVLPEIRDHVFLRLVLASDGRPDLSWLETTIEEIDVEIEEVRANLEDSFGKRSTIARLTAEEVVAGLERRAAFLRKILGASLGSGALEEAAS